VFLIDKFTGLIFKKKVKTKEVKTHTYVELMGKTIDDNHDFLFEDFRKLKESARFQKGVIQAYQIYENGESSELNFDYIIKKYPKNSIEYKAMETVIEKTKELMMEKQNKESK
jgi:hypothetical protein